MDTYGSRKAMPYSMLGHDESVQERYMHMTNKLRYLTQPTLICVPGALIEQRSLRQVVRPAPERASGWWGVLASPFDRS